MDESFPELDFWLEYKIGFAYYSIAYWKPISVILILACVLKKSIARRNICKISKLNLDTFFFRFMHKLAWKAKYIFAWKESMNYNHISHHACNKFLECVLSQLEMLFLLSSKSESDRKLLKITLLQIVFADIKCSTTFLSLKWNYFVFLKCI